jgi:hypothetical protein
MSLSFTAASSQYMSTTSPPITAAPFTVCYWFKVPTVTVSQYPFGLGNSADTGQYFGLFPAGTVALDPVRFVVNASANSNVDTTTSFTANTWHHACAVEAAANDHRAYLDGAGKQTEGTTRNVTGINRMSVGALLRTTASNYLDGLVAHLAIWDRALTDAEVLGLAGGDNPLAVQAADLVYYNTFLTTASVDVIGALSLTNNGTVTDDADMPTVDAPPSDVSAWFTQHQPGRFGVMES